ncbi:helix-turn-helix domain-containing protein [Sphingomonas sp. PR090111-T3T-6A]|uniref:helix-turn-helix domain-containing protein n=1 Tax=Sphingomonas sp. PR090111-T3T-6A TaxID=685778 RepID=UPI000380BCB5|nr:helix-turn-helix domain-containing protein [Sphingomonas sp. PR090111-T3T-6A]
MDEMGERAADGPTTVGARLRAAREARGQSLDEIGKQTRVPVRHLVQIEDGRLEGLPAAPYSAGFVKAYARAVDLDPVLLSQDFRSELAQVSHDSPRVTYEPYEPADPVRLPPRLLAIVALVIAVVLAAGYGIWRSGMMTGEGANARAELAANGDQANQTAAAAPAATATANTAPQPAVQAPAPPTGGPVQLVAVQPTWVKISERNGPTLFMGVLDKGKTYDVPATAVDPVIRTGRPEGLTVTVGGKPVAPLGKPAHTISNVSLKAAALVAGVAASAPAAGQPAASQPQAAPGTPSAFRDGTQGD